MSGKPEMLKRINLNLIYKALIELHTATRLELAEKTGISLTTVRAFLDELLSAEEIIETELDQSSGGRRAQRYALNPQKNLILLVYLNIDSLTYKIINFDKEVLACGEESLIGQDKKLFTVNFVGTCAAKWCIRAIGIAAHGVVENGIIHTGCKMGHFQSYEIGEKIRQIYNIPVILENDVNAVAFGFAVRYLAHHPQSTCETVNLAYVRFDKTAVGAGFVVDGKILHGARKFAGELAYMPILPDKTLAEVINAPDTGISVDNIARVLAMIGCITNPAMIVLGGQFIKEANIQVDEVEARIKQNYLSPDLCPEIIAADNFLEDCLLGIQELTFYNILPLLPI